MPEILPKISNKNKPNFHSRMSACEQFIEWMENMLKIFAVTIHLGPANIPLFWPNIEDKSNRISKSQNHT